MLLGAVADDITGATDLCLMMSREGMRTVQVIGLAGDDFDAGDADAVVVALKSRTIPADEAVALSLAAGRSLMRAGARQLFFKYCSTFDSTDRGNIGPVAEALLDLVGGGMTIACPAFPANGRTVYQGHLFVGDRLLSDSSMRDHPLTPMRDADLVRVLQRQTQLAVGRITMADVGKGVAGLQAALDDAGNRGVRIAILDALNDADLRVIGEACADMALITGGSGVAMGLPENFRRAGLLTRTNAAASIEAPPGRPIILAGSCSAATRRQIDVVFAAGFPTLRVDVDALADGRQTAQDLADWALAEPADSVPLIYSSAAPGALADIQARLGRDDAGALVEASLAETARLLQAGGFSRFLVAGGETSGAVVAALGVRALEIGPEIDPGVPWTRSIDGPPLVLALKSGNFGAEDFFLRAWSLLVEKTDV